MGIQDVYYQRPVTPNDDNERRINDAFGSLPGLRAQYDARMQRQNQEDFLNSAITPEQEAVMALQADDAHIPSIAARYKARKGMAAPGGMTNNNTTGFGGPSPVQSTGMIPAGPGTMPRVAASLPQPIQRGMGVPPPQQTPMTQRQYQALMQDMGPIAQQQRGFSNQRDTMEYQQNAENARQQLQLRSQERIAMDRNQTNEDVSYQNQVGKQQIEAERAAQKQAELDFKKEKEEHWVSYHKSYLQILRDRIEAYKEISKSKAATDPNVKAALEAVKSAATIYKGVVSQPLNNLTEQGRTVADSAKQHYEEAEKKLQEALQNAKPQQSEGQTVKEKYKGDKNNQPPAQQPPNNSTPQPQAPRKFTVGQQVKINGQVKTVTAVDANGKIVSTN